MPDAGKGVVAEMAAAEGSDWGAS